MLLSRGSCKTSVPLFWFTYPGYSLRLFCRGRGIEEFRSIFHQNEPYAFVQYVCYRRKKKGNSQGNKDLCIYVIYMCVFKRSIPQMVVLAGLGPGPGWIHEPETPDSLP